VRAGERRVAFGQISNDLVARFQIKRVAGFDGGFCTPPSRLAGVESHLISKRPFVADAVQQRMQIKFVTQMRRQPLTRKLSPPKVQ